LTVIWNSNRGDVKGTKPEVVSKRDTNKANEPFDTECQPNSQVSDNECHNIAEARKKGHTFQQGRLSLRRNKKYISSDEQEKKSEVIFLT
jgi:hypothetical protein